MTGIVILNYNSSSDCAKCISYIKQQQDSEYEIIVVDNCSKLDDIKQLRQLCINEKCTLLENKENRGYNAGNNIGLRYAAKKGFKYALIINPDMELIQTEYLSRMIEKMEEDQQIVVIGSDIITPEGVHQNPKVRTKDKWYNSFGWVKDMLHRKASKNIPTWVEDPHSSHLCQSVNGCCFLIKIDFLKNLDFFDENIFLYGEETILGRQVELTGNKMYYLANVQAIHAHIKSKEGGSAFCSQHWQHSQLHYIRYYSGFPFYGRWFAALSCRIYFAVLNIYHHIKDLGKK